MNNLFRIIVVISVLCLGCSNRENDFVSNLLSENKNTKIWNYFMLEKDTSYRYLGYKFKFLKEQYHVLYSNNLNDNGIDHDAHQLDRNVKKRFWTFNPENMRLDLGKESFNVYKYNSDTIYMKGRKFDAKVILVKVHQ